MKEQISDLWDEIVARYETFVWGPVVQYVIGADPADADIAHAIRSALRAKSQ